MATTPTEPAWAQQLNRSMHWCFRHWLLLSNSLVLLYAGLPWLSPLAKAAGYPLIGEIIFRIYTPLCHQIPERSFFICGHQVGFCHRCTAMYTSLLIIGLLFALLRRWIKPQPIRLGGFLLLPMLLDGGSHLFDDLLRLGWRGGGDAIGTVNFWLRMITGVLFAIAILVTIYPRLERDLKTSGLMDGTRGS